jgi:hypothetical protein
MLRTRRSSACSDLLLRRVESHRRVFLSLLLAWLNPRVYRSSRSLWTTSAESLQDTHTHWQSGQNWPHYFKYISFLSPLTRTPLCVCSFHTLFRSSMIPSGTSAICDTAISLRTSSLPLYSFFFRTGPFFLLKIICYVLLKK